MKIAQPTLLLDEVKCRKNINRMYEKARVNNVVFRPHFKTHQSTDISHWLKEAGTSSITVSSVRMAIYFANYGWNDILIAFPFNILETDSINGLPIMTEISLTVESVETVKHLCQNIQRDVKLYIKVDTGYHRTGINPENKNTIDQILNEINDCKNLKFVGFLSHFGNTYDTQNKNEIIRIHQDSKIQLLKLKEMYQVQFPELIISIGDTPSCSIVESFDGVDEIRPGNFIFYDLQHVELGACNNTDISVALACPVVAIHPERNEIVIYGGGVHLSKEYMLESIGDKSYGKVVELRKDGWGNPIKNTYVSSISQEHGIIKSTPEIINKIKIGNILGILPIHSCMTANLASSYLSLENKKLGKMQS